jgi:hypothetical protein
MNSASSQFLILVLVGLLLAAVATLSVLFINRSKVMKELNRTQIELEELRLAKAANERLISKLESQLEELHRAARRSLNE